MAGTRSCGVAGVLVHLSGSLRFRRIDPGRAEPLACDIRLALCGSPLPDAHDFGRNVATDASPHPTATATPTASSASNNTDWRLDLFAGLGIRHQYPDGNTLYGHRGADSPEPVTTVGNDSGWTVDTNTVPKRESWRTERAHMVRATSSKGSDPLGVTNALNHYGP